MAYVKDFTWNRGMRVDDFVSSLGSVGFQSIELEKAVQTIIKMKETFIDCQVILV